MAQRNSGHARIERDAYMTPVWATDVLIDALEKRGLLPVCRATGAPGDPFEPLAIWEPAAGTGQMAGALAARGYDVFCSDVDGAKQNYHHDFSRRELPLLMPEVGAIITNPPYDQADTFVANALDIIQPKAGLVAMLLKVDWDSAKTRARFFGVCSAFALKIVLVDRIHWFDPEPGSHGPSENHAWFVWSFSADAAAPGARGHQKAQEERHPKRQQGTAQIAYAGAPDHVRDALRAAKKKPKPVGAA